MKIAEKLENCYCAIGFHPTDIRGYDEEYTWLERKLLVEAKEWTYEMCLLESKKYKSRTEFSNGSPKQYQKSVRKGWI